jgi:hypothetical protein
MAIVTPTQVEHVAWQGTLVQAAGAFSKAVSSLPKATLGEPVVWKMDALKTQLGKEWTPPADGRLFALVRIDFTLHPLEDSSAHYPQAQLNVFLRPRAGIGNVVALDLFPVQVTAEKSGKRNVKLAPELKFVSAIDFKPGELGVEIEHHDVFPVIQAFGVGQSNPYWVFKNDNTHKSIGSQSVYFIVAVPPEAQGARLSLELTAQVKSRFGSFIGGVPEEARANLSKMIV